MSDVRNSWRYNFIPPNISARPNPAPNPIAVGPAGTSGLADAGKAVEGVLDARRKRQEEERARRVSESRPTYRPPGEEPTAPDPRLGRELGNAPLPERPVATPLGGIGAAAPARVVAAPARATPTPAVTPGATGRGIAAPAINGWRGNPPGDGGYAVTPYSRGGDTMDVAEPPNGGGSIRPEPPVTNSASSSGSGIDVPVENVGRTMAEEQAKLYDPKGGANGAKPGAAPSPLAAEGDVAVKAMSQIGGAAGKAMAMAGGGDVGSDPALPVLHTHGYGLVSGASPGRADTVPAKVRPGSYVVPADVVSGAGQGNTSAGAHEIMRRLQHASTGRHVGFAAGGDTGTVDVALSGGEVVVPPEDVLALGDGDHRKGSSKLDNFIKAVREHVAAMSKGMPPPR